MEAAEGAKLAYDIGEKAYKIRQGLRPISITPAFVMNTVYYDLEPLETAQSHLDSAIKDSVENGQIKADGMHFHYKVEWHDEEEFSAAEDEIDEELQDDDDSLPTFLVSGFNLYLLPISVAKLPDIVMRAAKLMAEIEDRLRANNSIKIQSVAKLANLKGKYEELGKIYQKLTKKLKEAGVETYHDLQKVPDGFGMIAISLSGFKVSDILAKVV